MREIHRCPYCRFEVPWLASVCGHCREVFVWRDGVPTSPGLAAEQDGFARLMWQKWPWPTYLAVAAAVALFALWRSRDALEMSSFFVIPAVGLLIGWMVVWPIMWVWLRIKYRAN